MRVNHSYTTRIFYLNKFVSKKDILNKNHKGKNQFVIGIINKFNSKLKKSFMNVGFI